MGLQCNKRRQFFRQFSGVVAFGASTPLFSKTAIASLNNVNTQKSLSLYNRHTGEHSAGIFANDGILQTNIITQFDNTLRDHRQNESAVMDRKLYEMLFQIQQKLVTDKEIHIISGFRSEKTNAMLASKSNGVAKKSFHMRGMAIDFAIPGVDLSLVRDAALSLKQGGVGYYPNSGFIHIDTGWVRNWRGS